MNRVYLNTIAVKGGNFDEIHSYHIDLMLQTYLHADSLEPLDVMDVLWNNLWMAVMDRKAAVFGPYIMLLILDAWQEEFHVDLLDEMEPSDIVKHRPRRPQIKTHKEPKDPNAEPEINVEGEADDPPLSPMGTSSVKKPSWHKSMMNKLKKSFGLKLDLQSRLYEAHVRAKKAAQRQKALLRHLKLPVSDGSEYSITSEEKWISKQHWTSSEDDEGTSTVPGGWANVESWGV